MHVRKWYGFEKGQLGNMFPKYLGPSTMASGELSFNFKQENGMIIFIF